MEPCSSVPSLSHRNVVSCVLSNHWRSKMRCNNHPYGRAARGTDWHHGEASQGYGKGLQAHGWQWAVPERSTPMARSAGAGNTAREANCQTGVANGKPGVSLCGGAWACAERMKMKTPHIVRLSARAVEVLHTLAVVSGHSKFRFPGERDHDKPMSNTPFWRRWPAWATNTG